VRVGKVRFHRANTKCHRTRAPQTETFVELLTGEDDEYTRHGGNGGGEGIPLYRGTGDE